MTEIRSCFKVLSGPLVQVVPLVACILVLSKNVLEPGGESPSAQNISCLTLTWVVSKAWLMLANMCCIVNI